MKPYDSGRGGRPAKFDEPSRPVTMTLPDRILDRLAEIGEDLAGEVVDTGVSVVDASNVADFK